MEKLIEQEQEKPTKTRADKRTRRKNSFFSDAVDKLHKKDSSYRNISYFRFLLTLLSVIIGALALRSFIVEPTIVDGESMQTTLMDGERVLVEKVSYWFNEPQRGDIVIVRFPNRNECFVKRIIAFGGETIEIRDGFVYIDGKMLDETEYAGEWYGKIRPSMRVRSVGSINGVYTVPEGCVFVMGDNRNNSHDSRAEDVNAIPIENVLGKARCRIWPLDRGGSIYGCLPGVLTNRLRLNIVCWISVLPSAVVPLRQHLFFMLSSARFSLPKAGFVISSPEIACLRTESANMSSDFPAAIR